MSHRHGAFEYKSRNERIIKWNELNATYESKTKLLENEYSKINSRLKDLHRKQREMAGNNGGTNVTDTDILTINAGGQVLSVRRGILTQVKGTRLEALFCGRYEDQFVRDEDGHIFLDINPVCFRKIFGYLEELAISPPDSPPQTPSMDRDHELYFDSLARALGLAEDYAMDSSIMKDLNDMHKRSLYSFLAGSNVHGELHLLYRASRDGWKATNFHERCDYQGETLTLIQTDEGYVFGGYADTPWSDAEDNYYASPRAFLFTLQCYSGIGPTKMEQIDSDGGFCAVHHSPSDGPVFGSGHDLYVCDEANKTGFSHTGIGTTYECPADQNAENFLTGSTYFVAAEIEVFSVVNAAASTILPKHANDANASNDIEKSKEAREWISMKLDGLPEQIEDSLEEERKELVVAWRELVELEYQFDREDSYLKFFIEGRTEDIVHFDVNGKRMSTKRSTLGQCPQSVLAKQFIDKLWSSQNNDHDEENNDEKDMQLPVEKWDAKFVAAWVRTVEGIPEKIALKLFEHQINGIELLALEREDLKNIGIERPGSQALIMKAIQKLKQTTKPNKKVTFIAHSQYCFGKILDQLRIRAMHYHPNVSCQIPLPFIRDSDWIKFKKLVKYYFPDDNDVAMFIGPS